jgi:hypothetical protein
MAEVLGVPGLPADVLRVVIALLILAAALPSGARVFHVLRTAIQRPLDGRSGLRVSHKASRIHARQWWGADVPNMSEEDFARTFRVPRAVFAMLAAAAVTYVLCTGAGSLPTDMQVAIGLYKLARPISFYDLGQKFGVSTSAAHFATSRFITFLIDTYGQKQLFDRWPTTAGECAQYSAAMAARTSDPLRMLKNCIGALDGTLIPIWCKESMQRLYQCRKGFHAISIQAVCNGLGFFIWIGGARPGSTWDGNAIKNDTLEALLAALPPGFFVLADSGYVGTGRLLTPYKRARGDVLSAACEHWNYLHSLCRGIIEKVYGIAKAKWRWMLRGVPLSSPEVYADYFFASAILHNMVLEHNMKLSYASNRSAVAVDESAWLHVADGNEDDFDMVSFIKTKYHKFAGKIEEYVKSIALTAAAFAQPGVAVEMAVDDDAADGDGDDKVVIPDAVAGKALREAVFKDMKMDSWVPTKRDVAHTAFRQRRAASRGRKERGV